MPRRTSSRRVPRKRRPKKKTPRRRTRRPNRRRRKYTDNTISVVIPRPDAAAQYVAVDTSKLDILTPFCQVAPTGTQTPFQYLQGSLAHQNYYGIFRYYRIKWLKVQFIPEKWMAVTLTDQASGAEDGEKPRIHWIADDGSFNQWQTATSPSSVALQEAETFGSRVMKTRQFTKTFTFWVKPYFRINPELQGNSYATYSKWQPTNTPSLPALNDNKNLWFGFSNVPTGFTYRTVISACVCYKDPYTEYIPPPLTLEEKKDEEPPTEELAAVKLS